MTKNLSGSKKIFKNKRGSILPITLAIVAIAGLGAIVTLSTMLAKITYNVDYGHAAYFAANTCLSQTDNLSKNIDPVTCVAGTDIDFAHSSDTQIVCASQGESNTIRQIGDCTCTTQILSDNVNSFEMTSRGVCPSNSVSGSRAGENKYSVSITKTISGCLACSDICQDLGSVAVGGVCGNTRCAVACDLCCANQATVPPCNRTTFLCQ